MGCVMTKQTLALEDSESPREKSSQLSSGRTSMKQECGEDEGEKKKANGPMVVNGDGLPKRRESRLVMQGDSKFRPRNVPRHSEGEQVAAGWPAWLSAVAGEAIKGWIPRRADTFQKLDKIGQGTYSNVYKARDIDTGKIVALKKVRFDNLEPESVKFMAREILVLRRLDHPNVVKLEGLVTSRMSCSLYLVFEYMEHDLAGLAASQGIVFTEPQVANSLDHYIPSELTLHPDYVHTAN
ncbi:hypothetical protein KI387_009867 [Taxus chinensis]|uniref:Protein kinase domain-containing protein n=1 Tax=Taxus chinensis TaxID=29808 RepID=A0AA38KE41_TAXCH|nr:hypothetical protein KI387_009867 [Taxus chinensis]